MKHLWVGRRLNGDYQVGTHRNKWKPSAGFDDSALMNWVFGNEILDLLGNHFLKPGECVRRDRISVKVKRGKG